MNLTGRKAEAWLKEVGAVLGSHVDGKLCYQKHIDGWHLQGCNADNDQMFVLIVKEIDVLLVMKLCAQVGIKLDWDVEPVFNEKQKIQVSNYVAFQDLYDAACDAVAVKPMRPLMDAIFAVEHLVFDSERYRAIANWLKKDYGDELELEIPVAHHNGSDGFWVSGQLFVSNDSVAEAFGDVFPEALDDGRGLDEEE